MAKRTSRKEEIEYQATLMFENKGFSATSMRELALQLNIEASSLYAHIRSKEELLQNICFNMANDFFAAIEAVEGLPADPLEKLKTAIIAHVKVITNQPAASAVFFTEWRHLSEPGLSRFLKLRENYEQKFLKFIDDGIAESTFDIQDRKLTVLMMLSSLNWIHQWYKPQGAMDPEEIGQKLGDLLIYGLKGPAVSESETV